MARTAILKGCLFLAAWGFGSAVSVGAAQDHPHGISPRFEVAVIKENHSVDAIIRITGIKTGDTFTATNVMDPKTWTKKIVFLDRGAALKMKESQCPKRGRAIRPA